MRPRRAVFAVSTVVSLLVVAAAVAWFAGWGPFGSTSQPGPSASPSATTTTSPAATEPATDPATPVPTTAAPTPVPDPTTVPSDPPQDDDSTEPGTAPTGGTATVVITYAEWVASTSGVEVGAYAAVVEDGGTCTVTLTRSGSSVTRSGPAYPDASTVSCGGFLIPGAELSTGTWSAVVSYASPSFSGTSTPVEVTVP